MRAVIAVQMITEIAGSATMRAGDPSDVGEHRAQRPRRCQSTGCSAAASRRVAPRGAVVAGAAAPAVARHWPGAQGLRRGWNGAARAAQRRQGPVVALWSAVAQRRQSQRAGPLRVYSLHPIPLHQRRPPVPSGFGYQPAGGRSLLMTPGCDSWREPGAAARPCAGSEGRPRSTDGAVRGMLIGVLGGAQAAAVITRRRSPPPRLSALALRRAVARPRRAAFNSTFATHHVRSDLDAFVFPAELQSLLQRQLPRGDQPFELLTGRGPHVGELLLLRRVDVHVVGPGVLPTIMPSYTSAPGSTNRVPRSCRLKHA